MRPVEIKIMEHNSYNYADEQIGDVIFIHIVIDTSKPGLLCGVNAKAYERKNNHCAHGVCKLPPKLIRFWESALNEKMPQPIFGYDPENQKCKAGWDEITKKVNQINVWPCLDELFRFHVTL
jgi:hypothetical protein